MGRKILRFVSAALGYALLTACAAGAPAEFAHDRFAPGPEAPDPRRATSATVLAGEQIWQDGGTLLAALRSHVSGMRVESRGVCPDITLRGRKTFLTSSNPQVYVNGVRAMDTCILEMTQAVDVERVEVYPMGVARRPGIQNHPYGLILVFLRRA